MGGCGKLSWLARSINWRTDGDKFSQRASYLQLVAVASQAAGLDKGAQHACIRSRQARQLASTKEPSMPVFFRTSPAGFTCESPAKDTSDQARAPRNDRGC